MEQQKDGEGGRVERTLRQRMTVAAGVFAMSALGLAVVAGRYGDAAQAPVDDGTLAEASALDAAAAVVEPLAEDPAGSAGDTSSPAGGEAGEGVSAAEPPPEPAPAIQWVSPRERSSLTHDPVPAGERVPKPEAVRGIYVGSWPVGSSNRLAQLIRLADETEINAFVIDVKDVTGEISYATQVPLAQQLGADRRPRIGDIRAVLAKLKEHGIYPIARIVAFKDPLVADARPEWAIQRADGSVWEDNKGVRWVDAFNPEVHAYNIEIAREAVSLGFAEVQWDYVRFPDAPQSYMAEAVYPARDGRTMSQGIRSFMLKSRDELEPLEAPITADVFGITTSAFRDVGIGQLWEDMADVMDVLLPMVYPSHYPKGTWDFPVPNAAPYQIVHKALMHGVNRSKDIPNAATIRPWLQAFDLGEPDYTPEYVRAQIDAVYDAGLTEWILWNPSARYSAEPLVTADGRAPWFAGYGESLWTPPAPEAEDTTGAALGVAADSTR